MPARCLILALLRILGLCLPSAGASAEEYRLQVANLYRDGFAHFIAGPSEPAPANWRCPIWSGRSTQATSTWGARHGPRPSVRWDELVRPSVPSRRIHQSWEGRRRWDEAVWEGKPGKRSVGHRPSATSYQEITRSPSRAGATARPLRYYVPYQVTGIRVRHRGRLCARFLRSTRSRQFWSRTLTRLPHGGPGGCGWRQR